MKDSNELLLEKAIAETTGDPAEYQVYAEYMSNIIKQLPNPGSLKLLNNTSSAQASFYFLDDATSAVNATIYNNLLNQRIVGEGKLNGVDQVGLTQDSFTNSYLSVYTKLRYQLSPADQATQQKVNADVASTVRALTPLWNSWWEATQPTDVRKLDATNTDIALIQMTATLNGVWLNPAFLEILQSDPSYPYTHMSEWDTIYNKIPLSVSLQMRNAMKEVFNKSGAAGAITADIANASQTISGIIANIQKPTTGNTGNGGMSITGSTQAVPGLLFEPNFPSEITNQLSEYPIVSYTNTDPVNKLSAEVLAVNTIVENRIEIPILNFFYHINEQGIKSSIFQEDCAGSTYHVKAIINNPVIKPKMTCKPIQYNIGTKQGWMLAEPAKEAIKNGYPPPTNVTGYVFNSPPNFNFSEDENFGYINAMVFSQFLELYIIFTQCNTQAVKNYFAQHEKSKFCFLGENIGFPKEGVDYTYEFLEEAEDTITILIKPAPPGYIPPEANDITVSMCQLVAVEVIYPFAQ